MTRSSLHTALFGLLAASLPALAQVTARQGEAPAETQFTSPMLLTLPLPAREAWEVDRTHTFREPRKFVCDDVVVLAITLRRVRSRAPTPAEDITVDLEILLLVRPSHDKLVTLDMDFVRGETTVVNARPREVEVEENRVKTVKTRRVIPAGHFAELFMTEETPALRISVSVQDD